MTLRLRRNGEIADQRGRLRGHFQRLASGEYAVELRVPAARFCVSYYADIKPRVLEKLAEL